MTKETDLAELRRLAKAIEARKGDLRTLYAERRALWLRRFLEGDAPSELAQASGCIRQNVLSGLPREVKEARRAAG